ncbi:MAG: class I tRNA ligase family protein, partial [Desulfobulbaceae bacterium]|nr:class I tRNA ligase family protein [Desulfobulbaceae bacterium]
GFLDGLDTVAAKEKSIRWLEDNGAGRAMVTYRFRDWLFSRQRYWGEPFPFIYDEAGNVKPVPDSALPVEIPLIKDWSNVRGELTPLAACKEWVNTVDPETGLPATRETNTMPQWAGSSWYYLRFCDPKNGKEPWSKDAESYWLPVDLYVGGVEHATLHLLYARFWHKVMYDLGLVSTKEPFKKLFNQGMITARSYKDAQGKYYYPEQVESKKEGWFIKGTNTPLETRVEKMSKSRYNVARPDDIIAKYGADTLRLFEMFIGPVEKGGVWQDEQIVGVHRFLERVHKLYESSAFASENDAEMDKILHRSIKKITDDVDSMNLNTAVSKLMVLSTEIGKRPHTKETLAAFTTMIAPFAPFLAEEGWQKLGMEGSVVHAAWPDYSPDKARAEAVGLTIQINGKVKGRLSVEKDVSQDEIWTLIEKDKELSKMVRREDVKKLVHVPNKIISFVL